MTSSSSSYNQTYYLSIHRESYPATLPFTSKKQGLHFSDYCLYSEKESPNQEDILTEEILTEEILTEEILTEEILTTEDRNLLKLHLDLLNLKMAKLTDPLHDNIEKEVHDSKSYNIPIFHEVIIPLIPR